MQLRNRFVRGLMAMVVTVATVTCAEAADRRRIVRPAMPAATSLAGRAVDVRTGAAVFEAIVSVQEKSAVADESGRFLIDQLAPGSASVSFRRWGYETLRQNMDLQPGANTLNVSLVPRSIVTLTDTSGRVQPLDYDSANFVYRGPLTGYAPLVPLEVCRLDGTSRTVEKDQIASITGPGRIVENSACCPNSRAIQITMGLKGGETFEALMPECKYYRIDFTGRDRNTGIWRSLSLEEVARLEYP